MSDAGETTAAGSAVVFDPLAPTAGTARSRARPASAATSEQLRALQRGLDVMLHLNRVGSASTAEVAAALAIKRPTAHRMLGVLREMGLVFRDPASRSHTLAAGALTLAARYRDESWLDDVVLPRLQRWSSVFGWPVALCVWSGTALRVRAITERDSPLAGCRILPGDLVDASEPDAIVAATEVAGVDGLLVLRGTKHLDSATRSRWAARLSTLAAALQVDVSSPHETGQAVARQGSRSGGRAIGRRASVADAHRIQQADGDRQ